MSILSQLFAGKITFSQAVAQGEQWFATLLGKAPPGVQATASQGLSAFKQAASNAVALADTDLGPILAAGVSTVEGAANAALSAAFGPAAAMALTPGVDAGITSITDALHAEIDAVAVQYRASIVGAPAAAQSLTMLVLVTMLLGLAGAAVAVGLWAGLGRRDPGGADRP